MARRAILSFRTAECSALRERQTDKAASATSLDVSIRSGYRSGNRPVLPSPSSADHAHGRRMLPYLKQGAQRRHERERLVQHHMVARLRNLDERDLAVEEPAHVVADVIAPDHRLVALHERDAAARGPEQVLRGP